MPVKINTCAEGDSGALLAGIWDVGPSGCVFSYHNQSHDSTQQWRYLVMTGWQKELQQNLGTGAERVVEAIADLADDLCGPDAVAWLDIRRSPKLVIYIVSRGVVHVITGNRPERQDPDAPIFPAACQYRATAVRRDWNWSLAVRQDERPNVGLTVYRKWTFDLPGLADAPLEMEYAPPPTPELSSDRDPAPFAKALVMEIVEAQRRFDG